MRTVVAFLTLLPVVLATPAIAQMDHSMPGMNMPAPAAHPAAHKPRPHHRKKTKPSNAPGTAVHANASAPNDTMAGMAGMTHAPPATPPVAGQPQATPKPDMGSMPGMEMSGPSAAAPTHDMGAMPMAHAEEVGSEPAPPAPSDHAADRVYDPVAMAAARAQLRREHGGSAWSMVMLNLAEYQARRGGGYRWEGEASWGGDINRVYLKSEGEGAGRDGVEAAELQVLYSRAISPLFNLQAGVRHDFEPRPTRTYFTVGFEGLAPYWFEVSGAAFVSTKGEVLARLEGYEDFRLTQRLILQPRAEMNLSAQTVRELRLGSGVTNLELGLRLRYEVTRQFAPYLGLSWDRKLGGTANFAKAAGESPGGVSLVAGVRTWF